MPADGDNRKFWKGVFSEPDGTPSFARVMSAVLAMFGAGWVSAIVWANVVRGIRPEFPDFMGLITFVGIFYGMNRAAAVFTK